MESPNITTTTETIITAIAPFSPDDNHKGTFLVIRIAGADNKTALKLINRKYRSWQSWRSTDEDFYRLDERIPELQSRFGSEAKAIRTSMLDIVIIEAGIMVLNRIITDGKKVSSDMWSYATKLAGLRVPLMRASDESSNPWEKLANSIHNTMSQRELTVKEIDENGREKSVTAKETTLIPNTEQQQLANTIVEQILSGSNN